MRTSKLTVKRMEEKIQGLDHKSGNGKVSGAKASKALHGQTSNE